MNDDKTKKLSVATEEIIDQLVELGFGPVQIDQVLGAISLLKHEEKYDNVTLAGSYRSNYGVKKAKCILCDNTEVCIAYFKPKNKNERAYIYFYCKDHVNAKSADKVEDLLALSRLHFENNR